MNAYFFDYIAIAINIIIFAVIVFTIILFSIVRKPKTTYRPSSQPSRNYKPNTSAYSNRNDHNATHYDQQSYSLKYAQKRDDKDSVQIKDKPLSEAERNVLYGK